MELHSIILFACFISFSAAATTRQIDPPTITISGSVFCNKCFQGSLTNELTTPLPAAEVKLQCAAEHTTAVTNENGIFKLTINSDYYASNEECQVKIVKSRDMNCKIPTNVGNGLTGASASENSASGVLNELLYSVGPFAFRPEKLTCPRSADQEVPSRSAKPSSAAASSSTSLFASNLPPLPPAIFPFPHPGFGHAPPITSSPLLPFNPPPYFDEQPTPDQSRPPPPNTEPPETVIPPNKPPSPPISHSSQPPPAARQNKHPPMHFPPPAMNRAPPNSPPPSPTPRKPSPPPSPYPAPAPKHSKKSPRGKSPSPPYLASPNPAPAPRPSPPPPRHGRSPPSRSCPPYEDEP